MITTASDRYPYAHIYLHEPKVKLNMSPELNTHKFQFDSVFDEDASNEMVYEEAAAPLVDSFLNGGRATLFAYGQTGIN